MTDPIGFTGKWLNQAAVDTAVQKIVNNWERKSGSVIRLIGEPRTGRSTCLTQIAEQLRQAHLEKRLYQLGISALSSGAFENRVPPSRSNELPRVADFIAPGLAIAGAGGAAPPVALFGALTKLILEVSQGASRSRAQKLLNAVNDLPATLANALPAHSILLIDDIDRHPMPELANLLLAKLTVVARHAGATIVWTSRTQTPWLDDDLLQNQEEIELSGLSRSGVDTWLNLSDPDFANELIAASGYDVGELCALYFDLRDAEFVSRAAPSDQLHVVSRSQLAPDEKLARDFVSQAIDRFYVNRIMSLDARMRALPGVDPVAARNVLELGSLEGRAFSPAAIQYCLDLSDVGLETVIEAMTRAGLIESAPKNFVTRSAATIRFVSSWDWRALRLNALPRSGSNQDTTDLVRRYAHALMTVYRSHRDEIYIPLCCLALSSGDEQIFAMANWLPSMISSNHAKADKSVVLERMRQAISTPPSKVERVTLVEHALKLIDSWPGDQLNRELGECAFDLSTLCDLETGATSEVTVHAAKHAIDDGPDRQSSRFLDCLSEYFSIPQRAADAQHSTTILAADVYLCRLGPKNPQNALSVALRAMQTVISRQDAEGIACICHGLDSFLLDCGVETKDRIPIIELQLMAAIAGDAPHYIAPSLSRLSEFDAASLVDLDNWTAALIGLQMSESGYNYLPRSSWFWVNALDAAPTEELDETAALCMMIIACEREQPNSELLLRSRLEEPLRTWLGTERAERTLLKIAHHPEWRRDRSMRTFGRVLGEVSGVTRHEIDAVYGQLMNIDTPAISIEDSAAVYQAAVSVITMLEQITVVTPESSPDKASPSARSAGRAKPAKNRSRRKTKRR